MPIEYFSGLDLGQAQDFTALAVLEQTEGPDLLERAKQVKHYAVRHLERLPLGTPYTAVAAHVATLFARGPLAGTALAIDHTGVGRPVFDMLKKSNIRARLCAITITAGHEAHDDGAGGWHVPKRQLVSVLQVLLQGRRVRVSPSLPHADTLVKELTTFQVKITEA